MDTQLIVEDLEQINVVTSIQYDPNNHLGYCLVMRSDLLSNTYKKTLYKIDIKSKIIEEKVFDFDIENYALADKKLLLVNKEGTDYHILSYDVTLDKLERICTVPYEPEVINNSKELLIFKTTIKNNEKESHLQSYRHMGIQQSSHIYIMDLRTSELRCISLSNVDVNQVTYDERCDCIVYTGFQMGGIKPIHTDIFTYDLQKKETKKYTNGTYRINEIGTYYGKVLFTAIELENHSRNDNQDIYCLNLDSGDIKPITLLSDKSIEKLGIIGDAHFKSGSRLKLLKNKAYYITIDRFEETLRSIDFDGNEKVYKTGLSSIDSFAVCDEGIIAAGLNSMQLHEIYWITEEGAEQITELNVWQKNKTLQKPEYFNCHVDGWVIPPINWQEGKKYPGVLMIHGGPKATYGDVYSHDMQLLSQAGYYVFYCNPRGSDGRGDDFANIRGRYGEWAYEDLMTWTDFVLDQYLDLDSDRLGVMGGSYGGYMTNYIITHTDRFKAAVSARGISSMKTAFLSSDIGFEYIYEYMGNAEHPWSNPVKYDEASPLNRAHLVDTPTLFMHGKEDVRCHYMESVQMYNALLYLGKETELCLFENEGHGYEVVGKPLSKQRRYEVLLKWFQKYFKEECGDGIG